MHSHLVIGYNAEVVMTCSVRIVVYSLVIAVVLGSPGPAYTLDFADPAIADLMDSSKTEKYTCEGKDGKTGTPTKGGECKTVCNKNWSSCFDCCDHFHPRNGTSLEQILNSTCRTGCSATCDP